MDLEGAAQAVLQLVSWEGLPWSIRQELKELAAEDLEWAGAITAYSRSNYLFGVPAIEGTLYSLVALLYLSRSLAAASDVEACAASSSATSLQVHCLLKFGQDLRARDLQDGDGDNDASELLEMLWSKHCLSNGFQVASEVQFERVFGPEDEDEPSFGDRPLPPVRAPTSQQLLDSIQDGHKKERDPIPRLGEDVLRDGQEEPSSQFCSIPRFFDLIAMITGSGYFVCLPSRTQGAAVCKVLAFIEYQLLMKPELQEQLQPLRQLVVSAYTKVRHDGRAWEFGDEERYLVPLTIADAAKLLRAVHCNSTFRHLVVGRPYKAWLLSHEIVVTDGAERARLFLARMDLPVFYHLPLTYAQLCTQEARGSLESEAFSAFTLNRLSPLDKELRQLTLLSLWDRDREMVLHMRPEDYAAAGVPQDSKAWRVIQKFAFPVLVERSETPEEACRLGLGLVAGWLSRMLQKYVPHETAEQQRWIFSDGKPDEAELSSPCLMEAVEGETRLSC